MASLFVHLERRLNNRRRAGTFYPRSRAANGRDRDAAFGIGASGQVEVTNEDFEIRDQIGPAARVAALAHRARDPGVLRRALPVAKRARAISPRELPSCARRRPGPRA